MLIRMIKLLWTEKKTNIKLFRTTGVTQLIMKKHKEKTNEMYATYLHKKCNREISLMCGGGGEKARKIEKNRERCTW